MCVCVYFGTTPTAQKDTRKVLREILARRASFSTLRDKIVLMKFFFLYTHWSKTKIYLLKFKQGRLYKQKNNLTIINDHIGVENHEILLFLICTYYISLYSDVKMSKDQSGSHSVKFTQHIYILHFKNLIHFLC